MNRREFSKAITGSLVAATTATPVTSKLGQTAIGGESPKTPAPKTGHKEWARKFFKGMENITLPSFTPDLKKLDEKGIRADVRHAINQGFVSTYGMGLGLTRPEMKRFLEVISDEARNKILVTNTMGGSTFDERVAAFKHAESIGVSQTLIALDSAKKTEDEIYSDAKALIDATNLGVVVYANPSRQFVHLHPSGLPMNVFDRLAALPNVIAVKLTQVINLAAAFQLAERIADRVHIGVVNLEAAPLFAKYNLQWSGQWAVDAVQSPEKQFAVEFLDLLGRHRMNEAMKVYWTMEPACTAFYELQAPTLKVGGHPWAHIKYYQWMTGGNGGLLRDLHQREDQVPSLDSSGRKRIRDVFTRIGVKTVDLPDEAFLVGNGAYSDGVRARDLVVMPHYKV